MIQKVQFLLTLLAFVLADENPKNYKRSLSSFGYPWNSLLGSSWTSNYPWQPISLPHGTFYPPPISYSSKSHFSLGVNDVAAAVAAAKEAKAAAELAHQKVESAREQVIIQERVAAAKEAAAYAAIQKSEALAVAAAAAHKTAAVAGHYSAGSWIPTKPSFSHWG